MTNVKPMKPGHRALMIQFCSRQKLKFQDCHQLEDARGENDDWYMYVEDGINPGVCVWHITIDYKARVMNGQELLVFSPDKDRKRIPDMILAETLKLKTFNPDDLDQRREGELEWRY